MMNLIFRGGNFALPTATIHEQIFRAAFESDDGEIMQQSGQALGDRPTQPAITDDDIGDGQADEMGGQPAPGGFYFG